MMSFINGVHQWLRQGAAGSLDQEEGGEQEKVVGVEWNGWDNDHTVGFDNGSKYLSGEYEFDI